MLADIFYAEPNTSPLKQESELAPFKPRTDVTFSACVRSPEAKSEVAQGVESPANDSGSKATHYHYDGDHQLRQIVVWAAEMDAYGQVSRQLVAEVDNPIRFLCQYYDAESGLHYNRFRYYDPQAGRYINQDPIGLLGGLNSYGYSGANPVNFLDVYGLAFFCKRPLNGVPWLGPSSNNWLDDFLNMEISHEQLFFEDNKFPQDRGFFEDSMVRSDSTSSDYSCMPERFNDCIMRKAVEAVGSPGGIS